MTRLLLPILALACLPGPFAALAEDTGYRKFTSSDGKAIEAKAVSTSGGNIRIRMRNGRTFDLPVTRFSAEDQEWIAEWSKGQTTDTVPELKISFDENMDESTEASGFVYVQTFAPELTIENPGKDFNLEGARATILLIVESVEKRNLFQVLSRETLDLAVPAGGSTTLEGKKAETKYATIQAHGERYAGHAVIVEDSAGRIIAHAGSRGWDRNPENALKAEEKSEVREKFESE